MFKSKMKYCIAAQSMSDNQIWKSKRSWKKKIREKPPLSGNTVFTIFHEEHIWARLFI